MLWLYLHTCQIYVLCFPIFFYDCPSVNEITINSSPPSAAYVHKWFGLTLLQIMACHLFGTKQLCKPMLDYCQLDPLKQASVKFWSKYKTFHSRKCMWIYRLRNGVHFVQGRWVEFMGNTDWYRATKNTTKFKLCANCLGCNVYVFFVVHSEFNFWTLGNLSYLEKSEPS